MKTLVKKTRNIVPIQSEYKKQQWKKNLLKVIGNYAMQIQ